MVFRKISADVKIAAVSRVFRGDRVTAVAREMGLDRNSLSSWRWRAMDAVRSRLGGRGGVPRARAPVRRGGAGGAARKKRGANA